MQSFDHENGRDSWRREKRLAIDKFFTPQNLLPKSRVEHRSPSGKYSLAIDFYSTGPRSWNYSRGIVKRIADGKIVADVKRNLGRFWHAWVQSDYKEYLLCGEDYQGYMVIDLTDEKIKTYLPDAAKNGGGFCWAEVYPAKDGQILAVAGCIWGGPYDLVFYDFSEPLSLPLKEIGRINDIGKVIGWESETVFAVEHEFEVRKSDGRRFESLSETEQEQSAFSYQTEILRWNRLTRTFE